MSWLDWGAGQGRAGVLEGEPVHEETQATKVTEVGCGSIEADSER